MSTTPFQEIGLRAPGQDEGGRTEHGGGGWAAKDAVAARCHSKAATGVQRTFQANDSRAGLARSNANGAARYYANVQARALGPRSPQEVSFCSSPPRPVGDFQSLPRRKKMRRSLSGGEGQTREEGIVIDVSMAQAGGIFRVIGGSDAETGVHGWMADEGRCSIRAILDDESDFVTRKMITTTPSNDIIMSSTPDQTLQGDKDEGNDVRELSPYVTPYRKGKGPKNFRAEERRPSYWDSDILPCSLERERVERGTPEDEEGKWPGSNGLLEHGNGVSTQLKQTGVLER